MTTTTPSIDHRGEQPLVGIRTRVDMGSIDDALPKILDEVEAWMARHGALASGPPLIRYHVIDMDAELDITIGFPVAVTTKGDQRIVAETLPAGRYASLVFTGIDNGVQGNAALIGWIADQGLTMDRRDTPAGDEFGGRVEHMIDGPDDDPDPSTWRTEVAIKLAESRRRRHERSTIP